MCGSNWLVLFPISRVREAESLPAHSACGWNPADRVSGAKRRATMLSLGCDSLRLIEVVILSLDPGEQVWTSHVA